MEGLKELGFELHHVGINCKNKEEAFNIADRFTDIFGFLQNPGNSSVFVDTAIEAMYAPYLGTLGHIAIGTVNVEHAMEYLQSQGVEFDIGTAKYRDNKLSAVYLKEKIGGFAVHLVKK